MSDALKFRFANAAEIGAIARLVSHSFPGPARPVDWIQELLEAPRYGGGADTLFVGEERGTLVAACQIHPLQQWVGGSKLNCAGIGTVAVSPVHRRRRIGAELVTAALRAAAERGAAVSALYPFRVSFYQELGYAQASEALQYRIAPHMLPDAPERMRVELLADDDGRAEALALFNEWARSQNGQVVRTPLMWAEHVPKHDRALAGYRDEGGTLRGYALAIYRADLPVTERYLEIDELVWTTPAARRGLYAWIASLGDQWREVLVRALPEQRLGDWIREPRLPAGSAPLWQLWAPAATLMAGTMFRIVDMQQAWRQRTCAAGSAFDITVNVQDMQVPRNARAWRLIADAGRVHIEAGRSNDSVLLLDISTLSRIYIGAMTATAAVQAGRAECTDPAVLSRLDLALALPQPWTFERF